MKYVPIKVCWVWFGERVVVGEGVFRKQENKTKLNISNIGEYMAANESIFDSNKLQSVYLRRKSAPI